MITLILTVLSILLGFFAWNVTGCSVLIFVAIVPFLLGIYYSNFIDKSARLKLLVLLILFKFFWVFSQVFWLKDVTYDTFFVAVILHTICFVTIQIPTILTYNRIGRIYSVLLFLLGWVVFEYFMQHFALLSPFYILGVMLGEYETLIAWFRWLGIEGGTLWILLVNLVLFAVISGVIKHWSLKVRITAVSLCFLPIVLSLLTSSFATKESKSIEVAALHTNFNPVNRSYELNPNLVIDSLWNLSNGISETTDLLLWPETIVSNIGWMQVLQTIPAMDSLNQKIEVFPNLRLTFGTNIFDTSIDNTDERLNYSEEYNLYYYVHNVALTKSYNTPVAFRSKEIFVPFQESVPYVQTFPSLKKLISVVGNKNLYAHYEYDVDLQYLKNQTSYVPLLCYEICFPMFTSKITKDADFVVVLGNEHWNTSKKGSYLYFNILKSITAQNAKPLVKSSNNGISVVLTSTGEVVESRLFNDTGLLKQQISISKGNALYHFIRGYSYILSLIGICYILLRSKRLKNES